MKPYLPINKKELKANINDSDTYVKEKYPADQTYLYTPTGQPIVFRNPIGFDVLRNKEVTEKGE